MMHCEYIYSLPGAYDRALFLSHTGLDADCVIDNQERLIDDVMVRALVVCHEGFALSPVDIARIFES